MVISQFPGIDGLSVGDIVPSYGTVTVFGNAVALTQLNVDMSVGFNGPAGDAFEFSISESLALLIRAPEAVCVLT